MRQANCAVMLEINGKGLGLFVARMRRWQRRNPGASLEVYLGTLRKARRQVFLSRLPRQKLHQVVDWFWAEDSAKQMRHGIGSRPQHEASNACLLAVQVLVDHGLIETFRKKPRVRVGLIKRCLELARQR